MNLKPEEFQYLCDTNSNRKMTTSLKIHYIFLFNRCIGKNFFVAPKMYLYLKNLNILLWGRVRTWYFLLLELASRQ